VHPPRASLDILSAAFVGLVSCACTQRAPAAPVATMPPAPAVTHGVAVGDVSSTGAIIWSRCAHPGELHVAVGRDDETAEIAAAAPALPERDETAKLSIEGLTPDTLYHYRAWCGAGTFDPAAVAGTFRTAPDPHAAPAVRFVWGGDLGGQNVCRDRATGYSIFDVIAAQRPDFFVALGDMIYADDACLPLSRYGNAQIPGPPAPALDLPGFWAHWKYNRSDAAFQHFLAATPYYAVWDDHEVMNDFGPHHDVWPGTAQHLLPIGLAAFLDYNPIAEHSETPHRLYRSVRWGRHLELLLLDTRQYRDPNSATDDTERPKTMLGIEQRTWLEDALHRSDATWKIIVSSVPLAIPTGVSSHGHDGWSGFDRPTGFMRELRAILRFIEANGIRNTLWISTDIHFAAVLRSTPFPEDPAFSFYEIDTGPLNAGVFPIDNYDRTLGTTRLFRYPTSAPNTAGFAQALSWFNFGLAQIDTDGRLTIDIVTGDGKRIYTLSQEPEAERRSVGF
jgi:alkaline phosphatase D